jgi:hypothetical protein
MIQLLMDLSLLLSCNSPFLSALMSFNTGATSILGKKLELDESGYPLDLCEDEQTSLSKLKRDRESGTVLGMAPEGLWEQLNELIIRDQTL